jgi:hypothetical protein
MVRLFRWWTDGRACHEETEKALLTTNYHDVSMLLERRGKTSSLRGCQNILIPAVKAYSHKKWVVCQL